MLTTEVPLVCMPLDTSYLVTQVCAANAMSLDALLALTLDRACVKT